MHQCRQAIDSQLLTSWVSPEQETQPCSDDSKMKKLGGGNCGAKEKSRGANINVSPAWWFSVVMKIDLL